MAEETGIKVTISQVLSDSNKQMAQMMADGIKRMAYTIGIATALWQGLEPILRPVLTLLKLIMTVLFLPLIPLMLPLLKGLGGAIQRIQQAQQSAGTDPMKQFGAGLLQMVQEPSIWGTVGGLIAAGMIASKSLEGISDLFKGAMSLLFKYPEASTVAKDIGTLLDNPLIKGLSALVGLKYGYDALKSLEEGKFLASAGLAAASAGFIAIATGNLKASGYLFVASIALKFADNVSNSETLGQALSKSFLDPVTWVGVAVAWKTGLLSTISNVATKGGGLLGGAGMLASGFGLTQMINTYKKELPKWLGGEGQTYNINTGWSGAGIDLKGLSTEYKTNLTDPIQLYNQHAFGLTQMSYPLGWAIIQAQNKMGNFISFSKIGWNTVYLASQNAVRGIIIELNRIPREIVTIHRIVTVYETSGKK